MPRKTGSLFLDALSLVLFSLLSSWRLTGIVVHEGVALLLAALLVLHLLRHADWVATRLRLIRGGGWRKASAAAWVNTGLFAAMGATLISGIVISKVVVPNHLPGGTYLKWHSLHESATLAAIVLLGLHLALNWGLVRSALRHSRLPASRSPAPVAAVTAVPVTRWTRRFAGLLLASVLLVGAVVAVEGLVPPPASVHVYSRDGSVQEIPPPANLARMQPGSERPSPTRGGPKYLVQVALLAVVAVVGRRKLGLRLS